VFPIDVSTDGVLLRIIANKFYDCEAVNCYGTKIAI